MRKYAVKGTAAVLPTPGGQLYAVINRRLNYLDPAADTSRVGGKTFGRVTHMDLLKGQVIVPFEEDQETKQLKTTTIATRSGQWWRQFNMDTLEKINGHLWLYECGARFGNENPKADGNVDILVAVPGKPQTIRTPAGNQILAGTPDETDRHKWHHLLDYHFDDEGVVVAHCPKAGNRFLDSKGNQYLVSYVTTYTRRLGTFSPAVPVTQTLLKERPSGTLHARLDTVPTTQGLLLWPWEEREARLVRFSGEVVDVPVPEGVKTVFDLLPDLTVVGSRPRHGTASTDTDLVVGQQAYGFHTRGKVAGARVSPDGLVCWYWTGSILVGFDLH